MTWHLRPTLQFNSASKPFEQDIVQELRTGDLVTLSPAVRGTYRKLKSDDKLNDPVVFLETPRAHQLKIGIIVGSYFHTDYIRDNIVT